MRRIQWQEHKGDLDGDTSIHFAAAAGRFQFLFNLVTLGCDVNSANNLGWTPLMQAARNGHTTCVKLLLDFGADVTIRNHFGICALSLAAASGNLETVSLILKTYIQRGIPVCEVEKYISPVFFAVLFNKIDILRYLNKYSYSLKKTIPLGGISPVIVAHILEQKEIIRFFKRRGIMAVNVQSPLLFLNNSNVHDTQFLKSTPFSCKTAALLSPNPNNASIDIPSFIFSSPACSNTPFNTPELKSSIPNPLLDMKKRRSSNFRVSPRSNTPCLSPIIPSDVSYHSAYSHLSNSDNSYSFSYNNSLMNARIKLQPISLTFSSTSSNDSSGHILQPDIGKNQKQRSSSYNVPVTPNKATIDDDVFTFSPVKTNNNHEFIKLLRRHSLDSCISLFRKHEIDMELFLTLSKTDLEEIGVDWEKRDDVLEVIYQCNKKRHGHRERKM